MGFWSSDKAGAAFTPFSVSVDELIAKCRNDLRAAARPRFRPGLGADQVRDLAGSIAEPFVLDPPRLVPGDAGIRAELVRVGGLPPGVPEAQPGPAGAHGADAEPAQALRIRLAVWGDVTLLKYRPTGFANAMGRYVATGTLVEPAEGGGWITADVAARSVRPHQLDGYRNGIALVVGRLANDIRTFCGSPMMQTVEWFREWQADHVRREAEDEKTRHRLTHLTGVPVG
jgi:hypothetical protein